MEIQSTTSQFARIAASSQNNDHLKASLQIAQPLEEADGNLQAKKQVSNSGASTSEPSMMQSHAIADLASQNQSPANSQQVGATVDHLA